MKKAILLFMMSLSLLLTVGCAKDEIQDQPEKKLMVLNAEVKGPVKVWPDATIPYHFEEGVTPAFQAYFNNAVEQFNAETTVQYVEAEGGRVSVETNGWFSYTTIGYHGGQHESWDRISLLESVSTDDLLRYLAAKAGDEQAKTEAYDPERVNALY